MARSLLGELQRRIRLPGPAGEQGEAGAPGSVVTYGTDDPVNGSGNNFDVYLQVDGNDIVQKAYQSISGVWQAIGDTVPVGWIQYNCEPSPGTGAFADSSGELWGMKFGALVHFKTKITINDVGTGDDVLITDLPYMPSGIRSVASGFALEAPVGAVIGWYGVIEAGEPRMHCLDMEDLFSIDTGSGPYILYFSGTYETDEPF